MSGNHRVEEIEADKNAYLKLADLKSEIDIVFNIAEGINGQTREAHIPTILDILNIPYTHSGPLAQTISLDKQLTKIILLHNRILTPKFQSFVTGEEQLDPSLNFPLIVKPNREGSSIGIFNENLVYEKIKLYERIKWLIHKFKEPVLVEEFIDGREFTVSVLGNNPAVVLPIVEQNFAIFPENMPHIASYEAKWFFEDNLPDVRQAYFCPAPISLKLKERIENICLKIFGILDIKDVCRIDLRIDRNENIYILEINTLPGMLPSENVVSYLPIAARTAGFTFEGLVNTILNEAVKRYGIIPHKKIHTILRNYWPSKFLETPQDK